VRRAHLKKSRASVREAHPAVIGHRSFIALPSSRHQAKACWNSRYSAWSSSMSGCPEKTQSIDPKTRRKLLDQRRMEFRRAIESYAEQRRLQALLTDYPELIAASYPASRQALEPRNARPAR
jgi:hypothetical protein